jgi:histidinol phosphatase-like PHP family hydrolase
MVFADKSTNYWIPIYFFSFIDFPTMFTAYGLIVSNFNCKYITHFISCNGHNRTNGEVVRIANDTGATLIVDTDSHAPQDLISDETAFTIALGAGLDEKGAKKAMGANPLNLIKRL